MSSLPKAVELFLAGRLEEARRACRKALRVQADLVQAHVLLAEIARVFGDQERRRESLDRVARLHPGWGEASVDQLIGDLWFDAGRNVEAEDSYRRALAHEPRALEAREHLARLLSAEQRYAELEALAREGMRLHPESMQFPSRLGTVLWRLGREAEALQAYRVAVERAGDPKGEAYEDAKLQEATALLALGRDAEGWQAYRWRHPRSRLRREHPELIDDPSTVTALDAPRRIRVLGEQGLGDELFFLRFAVALRARGHRLTVTCEPKLAGILGALPELLEGVNAVGEADVTVCSGDLPLASGQDRAPPLPLAVEPARREALAARLRRFGPPPYIGVTWRAGYLPDEAKPERGYMMRNVPADELGRALRPIDARIVILQRRPTEEDVRLLQRELGRDALDLGAVNENLPDALALLSLLDDYIGVSNTNMYLRSGLPGKSARVLVRTPPEWRWAGSTPASPWFPGFTVYRQARGEDWGRALAQLTGDLRGIYGAPQQK